MTKAESREIFRLLAAYYPNAKQVNKQTYLAWELVLAHYPFEKVQRAVISYVASHKYFPDVYDITGNMLAEDTPEQQAKDIERMKRMLAHMKKEGAEQ